MTIRWLGGKALALEVKARGEGQLRLFIYPEARTVRQRAGLPSSRVWVQESVNSLPEGTFLLDGPGEYEVTPFAVKVLTIESPRQMSEKKHWAVVVSVEECVVAYLDVSVALALKPEYVEAIGDVTVLVLSFPDSAKAVDREKAVKALSVLSTIEPKVFIPLAPEAVREQLLGELGAPKKESAPSFVCRAGALPEEGVEVVLLSVAS